MIPRPDTSSARIRYARWLLTGIARNLGVFACAVYSNFSLAVEDKAVYRFFPPFKPFINHNFNDLMGAEYYSIAKSLLAGDGFGNPFREKTGPTAWMPPLLSFLMA